MRIKNWNKTMLYVIVIGLIASAVVGCNVYEKTDIEVIQCPQVQDTIYFPDWGETE